MNAKTSSPVEKDIWQRIQQDRTFAEVFFEELAHRPLPVQVSTLRRMRGVSQMQLAARLHIKQSFLSKLEKDGSDHLLSLYQKLAKALKGRLAIIPEGARIVPAKTPAKLRAA